MYGQGQDAGTGRLCLRVRSPGDEEVEKFTSAGSVEEMAQASTKGKASRQEQAWQIVEQAAMPTGAATVADKVKVKLDTAKRYLEAGVAAGRLIKGSGKSVHGRQMDYWEPVPKEF